MTTENYLLDDFSEKSFESKFLNTKYDDIKKCLAQDHDNDLIAIANITETEKEYQTPEDIKFICRTFIKNLKEVVEEYEKNLKVTTPEITKFFIKKSSKEPIYGIYLINIQIKTKNSWFFWKVQSLTVRTFYCTCAKID